MSLRLLTVTFDAAEPARLGQFWAGVLGRTVVEDPTGSILPGENAQIDLRFVPSRSTRVGPNLMHLHLTSASLADQQHTVATALSRGARHRDVGQRPEEGHVVLADPEGNEFCVIPPGSDFLAGCGLLGEVACDGTREVGVFWSEALGWPLVWDHDQETAIQSPLGGTKVSWGGPPLASRAGKNRQRLDVTTAKGDQAGEVERLVCLGATRLVGGSAGDVALADPDGNEFWLTSA
jgi:catechol 2,3-dioxygenase-like lactoylglutathione lyase family enzyme